MITVSVRTTTSYDLQVLGSVSRLHGQCISAPSLQLPLVQCWCASWFYPLHCFLKHCLASHLLLHLGQPPVATPWPATCCYTFLKIYLSSHVKEVQIHYLYILDSLILNRSMWFVCSLTVVCGLSIRTAVYGSSVRWPECVVRVLVNSSTWFLCSLTVICGSCVRWPYSVVRVFVEYSLNSWDRWL